MNRTTEKDLALSICRDGIFINIPEDKNCLCSIRIKTDEKVSFGHTHIACIVDRDIATALKTLLNEE